MSKGLLLPLVFQSATALASDRCGRDRPVDRRPSVSIRDRSRERSIQDIAITDRLREVSIRDRSRERSIWPDEETMPHSEFQSATALASDRFGVSSWQVNGSRVSIRDRSRERSMPFIGSQQKYRQVSIRDRSRERSMPTSQLKHVQDRVSIRDRSRERSISAASLLSDCISVSIRDRSRERSMRRVLKDSR